MVVEEMALLLYVACTSVDTGFSSQPKKPSLSANHKESRWYRP